MTNKMTNKMRIKYRKIHNDQDGIKEGYHVTVRVIDGSRPGECPFGGRIWRTKKQARQAVMAAYAGGPWQYDPRKNTISC